MAALRKLFSVHELVEKVLLQLPLYDLLLASKVSTQLRQIISTSPAIRVRLLSDRPPCFVPFVPGLPESDDLCNASIEGPWLFRTSVNHGSVVILKTAREDVQLFVPDDVQFAVQTLDARRTRGAFHVNYKVRRGWANFYDAAGVQICRKTTSMSPWTLPSERPENTWDFLRNFNAEENHRYRQWIEKVCERDDWHKLFEIRPDEGYWL